MATDYDASNGDSVRNVPGAGKEYCVKHKIKARVSLVQPARPEGSDEIEGLVVVSSGGRLRLYQEKNGPFYQGQNLELWLVVEESKEEELPGELPENPCWHCGKAHTVTSGGGVLQVGENAFRTYCSEECYEADAAKLTKGENDGA